MKNIFRILAVAALSIFACASVSARTGVEIGYLNSIYRTKPASGDVVKSDPMSGFYVGLVKDMRVFAGLSIQPGLSYYYLNSTEAMEEPGINISGSVTEHMLNIPLHIKYTFDTVPAFNVYVFAGPTFSLGLAATDKISVKGEIPGIGIGFDGSLSYDSYTGKIKSDNLSDETVDGLNQYLPQSMMNRFDVLMGGGIGIDLVRFITVRGGFDYGLMNRYKGDLADSSSLNRMQFYVSVGIMF